MEFDIELTATTMDEGGMAASFTRQLEELGGTATLLSETTPIKVTYDGNKFYFEARRTYNVVL